MTSTRLSSSQQEWSPEFVNLDERSHVEAVRDTLRDSQLVPALTIAHREEFLSKLNAAVNRLIFEDPQADAQAGLNELASGWSALMEKYGKDEMRLSYARTLGLRIPR
jgi:NAD-dependent oxidoreductase involved in siderophore biosynthesis